MKNQQRNKSNNNSNSNSPSTSPSGQARLSHNYSNATSPVATTHFASSAFLNSPDPSKLPVPDFDDDDFVVNNRLFPEEAPQSVRKTDTLKQFLNIRSF